MSSTSYNTCPQCDTLLTIIINDGGSQICQNIKCSLGSSRRKFHKCKYGVTYDISPMDCCCRKSQNIGNKA